MRFKATVGAVQVSLAFVSFANAESPRSFPTNSLAFHLQSLGRVPTAEEREIIEATLRLMQRHSIRSDYPLRSVSHYDGKSEWVLVFDTRHPDAGFELFLTGKDANYVEVHWAGTNWRTRYPAETKKKR